MDTLRRLVPRRSGASRRVIAALAAAVALTLPAVWGAPAALARSAFVAERPGAAVPATQVAPVSELRHIKEAHAYLAGLARPITPPLVYLIGDSTTRESVVSEAKWAAKVLQLGGPEVQPYVLASQNQTFPLDRVITDGLPEEPALVLISVGLSRFTNPPAQDPALGEPLPPLAAMSPWRQHLYSASDRLTAAQKRAKVRLWLQRRYPLFKNNRAANVARLRALVQECQRRGWRVALLEMPVNRAVVGHAFDTPIARYRADCLAIASDAGIRFLRFTGVVSRSSANFYDLIHLVGNGPTGGRTKWQARLSAEVVKLMAE